MTRAARLHVVRIVDELDRVALDDDDSEALRVARDGDLAAARRPGVAGATRAHHLASLVARVDRGVAGCNDVRAIAAAADALDAAAEQLDASGDAPLRPPLALARGAAPPRRSRSGAPGRDADFEARARARARLPDLARDFRQEAGAARNGRRRRSARRRPKKTSLAPPTPAAQQAALSLRKIQDAGLGDAARVAAALRGERGADLGLDEDALELVRRVGLPPKAADDAGRSAARRQGPAAPPRATRTGRRRATPRGLAELRRPARAFDRCLADLAAGDARGRRADDRAKREAARRRARANHGLAPDGKGEVRDLFDDGANLLGMLERRRVAIEGGDDDDFASDEGDDDWDD
ncbi:actin binding protein [Aureococcus anophagefferens]|uniref:Actin binding protein n=1 Tax=Aureococcus anophagefferens TaxID=44056 RepID=A0ABR1FH50_AURAN